MVAGSFVFIVRTTSCLKSRHHQFLEISATTIKQNGVYFLDAPVIFVTTHIFLLSLNIYICSFQVFLFFFSSDKQATEVTLKRVCAYQWWKTCLVLKKKKNMDWRMQQTYLKIFFIYKTTLRNLGRVLSSHKVHFIICLLLIFLLGIHFFKYLINLQLESGGIYIFGCDSLCLILPKKKCIIY